MKLSVSPKGLLRLTAETDAETVQLNRLLNQLSLTASASIEQVSSDGNLAETRFISLQLQTSNEAHVAEVATVSVAEIQEPDVTLEVNPIPPANVDVVVKP